MRTIGNTTDGLAAADHPSRGICWATAAIMALALLWVAQPSSATGQQPADAPTASLHITADLQGRPPAPAAEWSTPLTVTLSADEIIAWEGMVVCDEEGAFVIPGLEPITYLVSVRGINTLTAQEYSPSLVEGTNAMHVGPLLAGDLNGDERIDIVDFSLFRQRYGSEDAAGDLNNSGFVDILDFSLLRTNFGAWGPTAAE